MVDDKKNEKPSGEKRQIRRTYLSDLAEEVSETHCPRGVVDPLHIASEKGITHSFGDYGKAFDGMLEYRQGRFHIYCNVNRVGAPESPRARFTVAHELGHYFIDEHRNALAAQRVAPHPSLCDFDSPLFAEHEADLFATFLLMPEYRFKRSALGVMRSMDGVLGIAEKFGASVTSAAVRLAQVDAFPCMVTKWNHKVHDWRFFSSSMYRTKFKRLPKAAVQLPADSPTRLALAQETVQDGAFLSGGTLASVWFPHVRRGSKLDVFLHEEAMPLGSHGALTLLYPPPDCAVFQHK